MAELYIGLMSGTSVDGIDAALVEFDGPRARVLGALITPFDSALRAELLALMRGQADGDVIDALARMDREWARRGADAVRALLAATGFRADAVRAIGSHGQTIRHRPPEFTLQIGDPNTLAVLTGIPVVADLRRKDVALGGEGAPLVPAFHAAMFSAAGETRGIVNLGGIANLTTLRGDDGVSGGDIGPANTLLDAWCERHTGARFDADGDWARQGRVHEALLASMLAEPFFARPAPKSTGRELFSHEWLEQRLRPHRVAPVDVQATLTELTARTVADAVRQAGVDRVFLCGGGARNRTLVERIDAATGATPVATTEALGLDVDHVESAAFAWLARETVAGRAGNLPAVTGAARPGVLGGIWWPG